MASANVSLVNPSPSHWRQPFFRALSCINTVWVSPDLGSSRVRLHSQAPGAALPSPARLSVCSHQHFVISYKSWCAEKQLLVVSWIQYASQCRLSQFKCILYYLFRYMKPRLTRSLKSPFSCLASSCRRKAIRFLILEDVQITRPLMMALVYSTRTRRCTSPTSVCQSCTTFITHWLHTYI